MPSLSVAARNAMLNALIATIGASPVLQVRTGPAPSVSASDTGTLLVSFTLGATWAAAAADGSIHLSDTPLSATALADGVAAHYRLKSSGGTTHMTGTAGEAPIDPDEESPELLLDASDIFSGGTITILSLYINTPS